VCFDEKGIFPDNVTFLADGNPDTCHTFTVDDEVCVPKYSHLKVQIAVVVVDNVNVTLMGTNLGCGYNLYVTPLSLAETEKWTGQWSTCRLFETSIDGGTQNCFYQCKCSGNCKAIQILKWPRTVEESSWTLCHVCLINNITGKTFTSLSTIQLV
jgi:hypothetical protein